MRKVILLGDGRISQRALAVLCSPRFSSVFDLKALVTNVDFYEKAAERFFRRSDVEFINNSERNDEAIEQSIRTHRVDLLLSVQHLWILPPRLLSMVSGQAFNLHNAGLPEYKGYNSIGHAIIDGVAQYRTTIHWMADVVDTGDIAFEGMVPVADDDTAVSLYLKTVDVAENQFRRLLSSIVAGTTPRVPVVGAGKFYGRHALDALKDVTTVESPELRARIVRAAFFPPLLPAYCINAGQKFYVLPEHACTQLIGHLGAANRPVWS